MTTVGIIAVVTLIVSAIAKAIMDHCKINSFPASWTWWNERTSWRNKWKRYNITQPRFPGSTTVFVWITDGWHFFQMIFINTLFVGAYLFPWKWWWFIVAIIGYKVIFEITYRIIKKLTS